MFDVKAIRDDPAAFDAAWARRGLEPQTPAILAADKRLREAQGAFQAAQADRNEKSKLIGAAKAKKDDARAGELMAEVEGLKLELPRLTEEEKTAETALRDILAALPNLPGNDVPDGADEHGNVKQRRWTPPDPSSRPPRSGEPGPGSSDVAELGPGSAPPSGMTAWKDHVALGEALGMMDFEAAARMSGARFVVLKKDLARLERALGQFMLDLQTHEHGYEEVSPPLLVQEAALFGTGQLPKFESDIFEGFDEFRKLEREYLPRRRASEERGALNVRANIIMQSFGQHMRQAIDQGLRTDWASKGFSDFNVFFKDLRDQFDIDGEDFGRISSEFTALTKRGGGKRFLIPTAEVSLTNLIREQITAEDALPLRYTALTPCFRSEAGSHGRDTRGMIRQHQFTKCELVAIAAPEQSEAEHQRMVECAEAVLKRLELPFRTLLLCAGDMGFSARKTYDLEVWLPSQATYREISSVSNCGDFQARRMDARIKKAGEKGTRFPHTLNGSGLAVGRTLVAVMENYQDEAGRIAIPPALQPYMGGLTHIGGEG